MVITHAELRAILHYDPESGVFSWVARRGSRAEAGAMAGTRHRSGYVHIIIEKRCYKAHRLAWLYMTGEQPPGQIDHINLNKADNAWENLRAATPSQNKLNSAIRPDNTSGFKGVSKCGRRWKAACNVNKVKVYLGLYDSPEQASAVYQHFAAVHHGEFFRSN